MTSDKLAFPLRVASWALLQTFAVLLLGTGLFMAGRLALLGAFLQEDPGTHLGELAELFRVALQLDAHFLIKILLCLGALNFLLRILFPRISFTSLSAGLYALFLTLCAAASVLNHYFYQTFSRSIDTFFFNFLNEDLGALAATIAGGYPLGWILAGLLLILTVLFLLLRWQIPAGERFAAALSPKHCILILLLGGICAGLCYQGGFRSQRTQSRSYQFADISTVNVINQARGNPVSLIVNAFQDHRRSMKIEPDRNWRQTWHKVAGEFGLPAAGAASREEILQALTVRTRNRPYLEEHRPNVVFVLSESLGVHFSTFEAPSFDILSTLAGALDQDYTFRQFFSDGNATQRSLIRLLFRTSQWMLPFHTRYGRLSYPSFVLRPYAQSGYDTYFVMGSACGWGNMGQILKTNGITRVICADDILVRYPKAEQLYWGISDGYVYRAVMDLLHDGSSRPKAVFILNTTNHPPYDLPEGYHGHEELNFVPGIFAGFPGKGEEEIRKHMSTYRYAAEMLGSFIQGIKDDPDLGPRTFVAFTGDHNARLGIYDLRHDPLLTARGVLFSLYIPPAYVDQDEIRYRPDRVASHKDIFPTLIEHTLSGQEYISTGCDLLSDEPCRFDFAYNEDFLLAPSGRESSLDSSDLQRRHDSYEKLLNVLFTVQAEPGEEQP